MLGIHGSDSILLNKIFGLMMLPIKSMLCVFLLSYSYVCAAAQHSEQQPKQLPKQQQEYVFENHIIKLKLLPRSAEQMLAFYEGRGFPNSANKAIAAACFMTVIIHNKTNQRLWLDLSHWQFQPQDKIKRLDRSYWSDQWRKIQLPQASRSTFSWTLLPEARDLYPQEGVGGNLTVTRSQQLFGLRATFITGENRKGKQHEIKLGKLKCL